MSIAGGVDRALDRGAAIGCTSIQMFTKNSNQWAARPLGDAEVERFRATRIRTGIDPVIAHDSYLINLCSPDDTLYRRSIDALAEELERCDRLGVDALVVHPGGHVGRGEDYGVQRMVDALDRIHDRLPGVRTDLVLETVAGQGSVVGAAFETLASIIERTQRRDRLGVCLDTCHVFAAGYDLRTAAAYAETMKRFDATLGLRRLRAVHVNDSKKDLGCRVDRHEHIGRGCLGLEAFRSVMNDPRLAGLPLLLETPKDDDTLKEDVENLTTLIGLVAAPASRARVVAAEARA